LIGFWRKASRALGGGAIALCLLSVACRREDPRIRELTGRAAQADEAAQQLRRAWMAQLTRLPSLGRPPGGPLAIPFTPEQLRYLQARINAERDISRKGLLQEAILHDQEIRVLGHKLEHLKRELPTPDRVRPSDSHYGLAMRFLRSQGIPDEQGRRMLSRAPILGRLDPGFEVYHFLVGGEYATWVAQGSSPFPPQELNRPEALEGLRGARDRAEGSSGRLSQEVGGLQAQRRSLEREISELRIQRGQFLEERENLLREEDASLHGLNSLHYLIAPRTDLERAGIVTLPLLGQSHAGPNWQDSVFNRHLDLRRASSILIRAQDLGLGRIGGITVVPGSYLENVHFRLILSPDRQTAVVELLVLPRFRNDKVVFAVSG